MIRMKRGQAAVEYLMTYGWAFMAILITLGALNYFGVLDVDNLRGQSCDFPPGIMCDEYVLGPFNDAPNVDAYFILTNTHGADLEITSFTLDGDLLSSTIDCEKNETGNEINSDTYAWPNEDQVQITCSIDAGDYYARQSYDLTMEMVFNQQGNTYEYNTSGSALITAQ